jgi:hypothetical protein
MDIPVNAAGVHEMPAIRDYYKDLGVSPDATPDQIETAWKNWKRDPQNHPDTHADAASKDRAEKAFQDHSEAYLILSKPAERRKYDTELEKVRAATGPVPTRSDPHVYGFNNQDPASEDADWGGGGQPVRAQTAAYSTTTGTRTGPWDRYLRFFHLTPLLIVTGALVGVWVLYIALSPHPAPYSGTNNPIVIQNTPSQNPGADTTPAPTDTPTASPTPTACPTGTPEITSTATVYAPGTGPNASNATAAQQSDYEIDGQITNPTNANIQISNIGFYMGAADSTQPPSWSDPLSGMIVSPSGGTPGVVPAGGTVSFADFHNLPASQGMQQPTVGASLNYPVQYGTQAQNAWSFSGDTCQSSS